MRLLRMAVALLMGGALLLSTLLMPAGSRAPAPPLREYQAAGGEPVGYSPSQIATAYDITPLYQRGIDGSGQIIALIELDGFTLADLQTFNTAAGLPPVSVKESYAGGKRFKLVQGGETTMDLEWAHAIAPRAALRVYYLKTGTSTPAGWKELAQTIDQVTKSGARVLSMSFGACTLGKGYGVVQQALARALKAGLTAFVSSGDSGSFPGPPRTCGRQPGVGYPAGDPSVVAVGGTTMLLKDDDTIDVEVAWGLSGGGKAQPFPRPSWQVMSTLGKGKYRYVPDVAFLADTRTGVGMYYRGRWTFGGGTSLGAPAWAGIWALIRQDAQKAGKRPAAAPRLLYQIANSPAYPQAFHDVTVGANGHYMAGVGWDPVTGWGTPVVDVLAQAVRARLASAASTL